MHKMIVELFPQAKDAVLIDKWFGKLIERDSLARMLIKVIKGKEQELLDAARKLEEEENREFVPELPEKFCAREERRRSSYKEEIYLVTAKCICCKKISKGVVIRHFAQLVPPGNAGSGNFLNLVSKPLIELYNSEYTCCRKGNFKMVFAELVSSKSSV